MDEKLKMELLEVAKHITNGISFKDVKNIEVEVEDWVTETGTIRATIDIEYIKP